MPLPQKNTQNPLLLALAMLLQNNATPDATFVRSFQMPKEFGMIDSYGTDYMSSNDQEKWKIPFAQMMNKYGNPSINLDATNERAFYQPITNTMTVNPKTGFNDMLHELAHSKQLKEGNFLSFQTKRIFEDLLYGRAGFLDELNGRTNTYDVPNTIENDAHYKIAPLLMNELFSRIDMSDNIREKVFGRDKNK